MTPRPPNLLDEALRSSRRPLAFAFLFSAVSNLLFLAFPLYMSQLYGRVFASHSVATLMVLSGGVIGVFVLQAFIDNQRSRILIRFGLVFDQMLSRHVFAALFNKGRTGAAHGQAMRELDSFRQTLTGAGIGVLFDAPWAPIFLLVLFVIDMWVGVLTLVGGLILLALALLQERLSRRPLGEVNEAALRGYHFTDMALRNAEVVRALGMLPAIGARWSVDRAIVVGGQATASERAGVIGDLIKLVRMIIQIGVMALGAFLVLKQVIGPAILFANMILSSKALAPFERLVGSWNELIAARQHYRKLHALLDGYAPPETTTALPDPKGNLSVQQLVFKLPEMNAPLLNNVSFELVAGEALGIVGPSGAGKSTLSRLLVGIWEPSGGQLRLDGAEIHTWDRTAFGRHVGYLPQDTELFTGSVRDNIARFRTDVSDEDIVRAAQEAGVHELILQLPRKYETPLGAFGSVLSVGQRQRLGLARALLGSPCMVILDEPNANLDADGEAALLQAMLSLKQRGASVVIVSHRASVFRHVDKMLVLRDGQMQAFGPRDAIMGNMIQPTPTTPVAANPGPGQPPGQPALPSATTPTAEAAQ